MHRFFSATETVLYREGGFHVLPVHVYHAGYTVDGIPFERVPAIDIDAGCAADGCANRYTQCSHC